MFKSALSKELNAHGRHVIKSEEVPLFKSALSKEYDKPPKRRERNEFTSSSIDILHIANHQQLHDLEASAAIGIGLVAQ